MGTLKFNPDHFGGVIIDPEGLPDDASTFSSQLAFSLDAWRQEEKRGVWLKVPITKSHLIDVAVRCGMEFHHAERDYLMLTMWLPPEPNTLPPNASHQVGVGAFVVNEKFEVLVVLEAHGPLKGKDFWKIPTGLVNQGEDLHQAAEREVLEETGVAAKFVSCVAFRHLHDVVFGKSDLFFVCLLRAEGSLDITVQESELEAAKWVSMEEFNSMPHYTPGSLYKRIADVCVHVAEKDQQVLVHHDLPISHTRGNGSLYYHHEHKNTLG